MPEFAESGAKARHPGRPSEGRDDITIKVSRALAEKIKFLALDRDQNTAETVDQIAGGAIDAAYTAMMQRRTQDAAAKKGGKP